MAGFGLAAGALGGIIGGISSAYTNQQNNQTQLAINQANLEQQWKMYEDQKATNLANWNMQNAYNHPSEQMKRLREGGLNPNLIYGAGAGNLQGGAVAPSSGTTGTAQAYKKENPIMSAIAGANMYTDLQMKEAQVSNLREQNKFLQAQTRNEELRGDGLNSENIIKNAEAMYSADYHMNKNKILSIDSQFRQRDADNIDTIYAVKLDNMIKENEFLKSRMTGQELDNVRNMIHNKLWNRGYNPNSPNYFDVGGRMLETFADRMRKQPSFNKLKTGTEALFKTPQSRRDQ